MKNWIKKYFAGATLVVLLLSFTFDKFDNGLLRVSNSGRSLVKNDGTPFFWLGDTGWALFNSLNQNEARRYLRDRKEKGFTVIQAHLLGWNLDEVNSNGDRPFIDNDFRRPYEPYWQHADFIIDAAKEQGLYMALLPAFAAEYTEVKKPDDELRARFPLNYDSLVAYEYGKFLGKRYEKNPHIIWILGGDVWGRRDGIYDNLARGLTETYAGGDPDKILISFHPQGGTHRPPATSTSEFYHNKSWLDFNMIQSGHRRGNRNYQRITKDYQQRPVKPTMESEPCYEQHPIIHDFKNGAFTSWDVRQRAYWSILAGGFGFTYGANGIWQMDKPGEIYKPTHHNFYWYDALNFEGASQMIYLKKLIESKALMQAERVPDQRIVLSDTGDVENRIQCARGDDYSYAVVYSTNGTEFTLDLKAFPKKLKASWYSPRDGKYYTLSGRPTDRPFAILKGREMFKFDPPHDAGPDNDWILLLDKL
jgi:hypothetical protein